MLLERTIQQLKKGEVLWEWGTQSILPFTSGAPSFHAQVTPQVLTGPPDN